MKEDGFTLVEALVALVLGAMVLSAVLSTVRVAALGAARERMATSDAEGFARAGTILSGDAAHALWIGDDAGRPVFLGRSDEIDLPQAPRQATSGGMVRPPVMVVYRIRPGTRGAILTRAEAPMAGGAIGGAAEPVVLWQAAGRLEFRFLDARGGWLRDWTARDAMPRALAVTDPALEVPQLVAALPDLVPLACASGPGPACPLPREAFQ